VLIVRKSDTVCIVSFADVAVYIAPHLPVNHAVLKVPKEVTGAEPATKSANFVAIDTFSALTAELLKACVYYTPSSLSSAVTCLASLLMLTAFSCQVLLHRALELCCKFQTVGVVMGVCPHWSSLGSSTAHTRQLQVSFSLRSWFSERVSDRFALHSRHVQGTARPGRCNSWRFWACSAPSRVLALELMSTSPPGSNPDRV
jgi:hypothetical protein